METKEKQLSTELPIPEVFTTGVLTETQQQIVGAINLVLAGQQIPGELGFSQEEIERITSLAESEPRRVEGREWYLPEDLREKILIITLPEQPEALEETRVFLAGDFTGWETDAWPLTHLGRHVFLLRAEGARGQQCKFFAHHPKMPVHVLGHHLARNGIEKPGIDSNKGNAWFLLGGRLPSGPFENDTW